MKMKRMFTKKHKPKFSSDVIYDQKIPDTVEETNNAVHHNYTPSHAKKKPRQRKKKKSPLIKETSNGNTLNNPRMEEAEIAYQTTDGTTVTLRRGSDIGNHHPAVAVTRSYKQEQRIPGSESSSRTASSASSSSSSQVWSARRPWSLVESQRGQSLSDLTKADDNDCIDRVAVSNEHNMTAPTICTLPRGASLEDQGFGKSGRSRIFTLDFSFFKRFKRPATYHSASAPTSKRLSGPQVVAPTYTGPSDQSSARSIKKGRSSKRQKEEISVEPISESRREFEAGGKRPLTGRDSVSLDTVQENVTEEKGFSGSQRKNPSSSESSSSRTSIGTVVSVPDAILAQNRSCQSSPEHNTTLSLKRRNKIFESRLKGSDTTTPCEKCQKIRNGLKQNACSCGSKAEFQLSMKRTNGSKTRSQNEVNTGPTSPLSLSGGIAQSLINLTESSTKPNAAINLGGSVHNISSNNYDYLSSELCEKSLTRRRCFPKDSSSYLSSRKSISHSSTPQISIPKVEVSGIQTDNHKSSVKTRLGESGAKAFSNHQKIQSAHSSSNVAVDSPIKQLIGYPGVVMRRQERRISGKGSPASKPTSRKLMTRDERAKQVLSLNVEDLPTYEKMRGDSKWRMSTESQEQRDRSSTETVAVDEWYHNACLSQQTAAHCTSADNVSSLKIFRDGQTMDDINNMDDDEYLNFYLATLTSLSQVGHELNRDLPSQDAGPKRVKNLRKSVASFANLISPGKPGKKMQRSSSFKESSGGSVVKPYRPSGHNNGGGSGTNGLGPYRPPGKRGKGGSTKVRRSKLWCETFDHSGLAKMELKRQEAIYELYQGECIMVDDLKMAKQTYRDSMVTLKMLTECEVTRIFGKLDCLLPLHEDLLARLEKTRTEDGKTDGVGHVFIDWFPSLSPYNEYCANQADAKETLDAVVSREARVRDFLQRCLESPFSRKLDLWSYLDLPRSRLVKYPLLLKAIYKVTPADHSDAELLEKAISDINSIISRVDDLTGERQAEFVKRKLEYLDDKKRCPEVEMSRKIICSGLLKNNRGTKLQVFLFDHALVLTRNATRGGDKLVYQVYRQPVALKYLVVDTEEGGKLSGSFRGGLLSSDKAKHSFRVKSDELNISYTLVATDEHDKKQWVNSLQEAIHNCRRCVHDSSVPRRGSSEKRFLGVRAEKNASIKRTSSVKSDGGNSSPWYRRRSVTLGHNLLKNKDKKEFEDPTKKSSKSPISIRRRSKPILEGLDVKDDDKSEWRRSRSLTSSPIAFLAQLPRRAQRSGSGLVRSESCYTKPPTNRAASFSRHHSNRSSGRASPKSCIGLHTGSIPDLHSYNRQRSNSEHALTLEAVRNRLALVESGSHTTVSESVAEESESAARSHEDSDESTSNSQRGSQHNLTTTVSSSCGLTITKSESSPARSMRVSCSSPSLLHSARAPTAAWSTEAKDPSRHVTASSCSSSSTSLTDVPSVMDDVEDLLVNAADHQNRDDGRCGNSDVANVRDEVATTLNHVLNRVCNSPLFEVEQNAKNLTIACSNDYITISSDDGSPWQGNNVEMTV